jgi:hypothetical protein
VAGTAEPSWGNLRGACIESRTDGDDWGGVSLRGRREPFICATGVLDLSPEKTVLERESGRGGDSICSMLVYEDTMDGAEVTFAIERSVSSRAT